jgi:hypothetical protein
MYYTVKGVQFDIAALKKTSPILSNIIFLWKIRHINILNTCIKQQDTERFLEKYLNKLYLKLMKTSFNNLLVTVKNIQKYGKSSLQGQIVITKNTSKMIAKNKTHQEGGAGGVTSKLHY